MTRPSSKALFSFKLLGCLASVLVIFAAGYRLGIDEGVNRQIAQPQKPLGSIQPVVLPSGDVQTADLDSRSPDLIGEMERLTSSLSGPELSKELALLIRRGTASGRVVDLLEFIAQMEYSAIKRCSYEYLMAFCDKPDADEVFKKASMDLHKDDLQIVAAHWMGKYDNSPPPVIWEKIARFKQSGQNGVAALEAASSVLGVVAAKNNVALRDLVSAESEIGPFHQATIISYLNQKSATSPLACLMEAVEIIPQENNCFDMLTQRSAEDRGVDTLPTLLANPKVNDSTLISAFNYWLEDAPSKASKWATTITAPEKRVLFARSILSYLEKKGDSDPSSLQLWKAEAQRSTVIE